MVDQPRGIKSVSGTPSVQLKSLSSGLSAITGNNNNNAVFAISITTCGDFLEEHTYFYIFAFECNVPL